MQSEFVYSIPGREKSTRTRIKNTQIMQKTTIEIQIASRYYN